MRVRRKWAWSIFGPLPMELSLGLFFGNQGQIGQPLSEEISLLKCSSRSKQKILGLLGTIGDYPYTTANKIQILIGKVAKILQIIPQSKTQICITGNSTPVDKELTIAASIIGRSTNS